MNRWLDALTWHDLIMFLGIWALGSLGLALGYDGIHKLYVAWYRRRYVRDNNR